VAQFVITIIEQPTKANRQHYTRILAFNF